MIDIDHTHDHLAAALTAFLAGWRQRAIASGKILPHGHFQLTCYDDGCGFLIAGGERIGHYNTPLAKTFAEAEAFIVRDEIAEMNLTLGLTRDGRFADAGAPL